MSTGPEQDVTTAQNAQGEPVTMIRSEEQLQVGTRLVETGHVRLVKRIVTEDVTITVPVSREEVFLERTPIEDGDSADFEEGAELTEHTWELVLAAERVVVTKVSVPVERVRMTTRILTEDQTVTDTVRKEHFDFTEQTDDPQPS